MNKTTAIKQAISESSMFRFGDGWKLSTCDESMNAYRESHSMPFHSARAALSTWRAGRATQLLTGCTETAQNAEYLFMSAGAGRWQDYVQSI